MSLYCAETEETIYAGNGLYAAVKPGVKYMAFLSGEAMSRVPEERRVANPALEGDGGINIHDPVAASNAIGATLWSVGVDLGKFLFSIDAETAKEFLPVLMTKYFPD